MTSRMSPIKAIASNQRHCHGAGFWLIAAVFVTAMAFSTVSTPRYPLYEKRDGFASFTVTIVFAVYAVGVVTSLLLFGHVSDWVGRRRILLPALSIEIVAAVVIILWPDLPGLIASCSRCCWYSASRRLRSPRKPLPHRWNRCGTTRSTSA